MINRANISHLSLEYKIRDNMVQDPQMSILGEKQLNKLRCKVKKSLILSLHSWQI